MELELTHDEGYVLAVTDGPIDASTHPPFRNALHPLFNNTGVNLIVDISASSRINSEGLSALVRLVTDANTRGGRVIYAAPSPFVEEVLNVTRLSTFFETAPSRDDAVKLVQP